MYFHGLFGGGFEVDEFGLGAEVFDEAGEFVAIFAEAGLHGGVAEAGGDEDFGGAALGFEDLEEGRSEAGAAVLGVDEECGDPAFPEEGVIEVGIGERLVVGAGGDEDFAGGDEGFGDVMEIVKGFEGGEVGGGGESDAGGHGELLECRYRGEMYHRGGGGPSESGFGFE